MDLRAFKQTFQFLNSDMENTSSTSTSKDNIQLSDSDSSGGSDSASDSASDSSDSSLEYSVEQNKVIKKNKKKLKPFIKNKNKDYAIRAVKLDSITKQIISMQGPLYTLLRNNRGHDLILKRFDKKELTTIKNIILSVEALKNIKARNGYYQLPEETHSAFKKCRDKIESFKKAKNKKELLDSVLALNKVDNFQSLRSIITANSKLYAMNRRISIKKNNKYGKK